MKYFIIGLAADAIIVFLTLLLLSASYDGTCHTLLGAVNSTNAVSLIVQQTD